MKTIGVITAIIISGILFLAIYPKGENHFIQENNDFINAMWESSGPHYSNQYFTLSHKFNPGVYTEFGNTVCADVQVKFDQPSGSSSVTYSDKDIAYSSDRYYIRNGEK